MTEPLSLKELIDDMGAEQFDKAKGFIESTFGMTIEAMTENYGRLMFCKLCKKKYLIEDAWDKEEGFLQLCCKHCGLLRAQKSAGVPELFRGCRLNEHCQQYVDHFETFLTKSLFIHGQTGTGKTFLASAILNELLRMDRMKAVFVESHDFFRVMRAANKPPRYISEEMIMRRYSLAPVLLFDDIFGSKDNDHPSEHENQKLYELVRDRNNFKLRTILTSNYSLEQLEKKGWNARIVSRIAELCKPLQLEGEDRRLLAE